MPRWVGPVTTRLGTPAAGTACGCVAARADGSVAGVAGFVAAFSRISVSVTLVTSPASPTRRVTTPTEPGGTTAAGTSFTSFRAGVILYVPGVRTAFWMPR